MNKTPFGTTKAGEAVEKITLTSGKLSAEIITYGATLVSLTVPDKAGNPVDVVLGYRSVAGYEENGGYLGATVGRYANRIAGASFRIDGVTYLLDANEGTKQLHGGSKGYSAQIFSVKELSENAVTLTYTEPDGTNGYPGTAEIAVTYTLSENGLQIAYNATCDKATYINLTNHSYFNLNGGGTAMNHTLWLSAGSFTPVDEVSIPTAYETPVAGTPFDFTTEKVIGRDIEADCQQLRNTGGYDHNFVLGCAVEPRVVARLTGDRSGIVMETLTDLPGVQLYAANFLETNSETKTGKPYGKREAVCLETQIAPDSPNHPEWADVVLRPGQTYKTVTEYRFTHL